MKAKTSFGKLWLIAVFASLHALSAAQFMPRPVDWVSGKEYTDRPDRNAAGVADPTRVLHWWGNGVVADSFKYQTVGEVDAIANNGDLFFSEAKTESAALLISVEGDSRAPILYEMPGTGVNGVWATAANVNSNGVTDLDALEVWGPNSQDDADRFSLVGDTNFAIYQYNNPGIVGWITQAEIAAAINAVGVQVDLDALMTFGDQIMFSVRPISGLFDGGEIWTYTRGGGAGTAQFLFHGGHLWNTAFDVRAAFGVTSENVDTLEAVDIVPVPEPSSMAAIALGVLLLRRLTKKS